MKTLYKKDVKILCGYKFYSSILSKENQTHAAKLLAKNKFINKYISKSSYNLHN